MTNILLKADTQSGIDTIGKSRATAVSVDMTRLKANIKEAITTSEPSVKILIQPKDALLGYRRSISQL
jgi:hypothetical protein